MMALAVFIRNRNMSCSAVKLAAFAIRKQPAAEDNVNIGPGTFVEFTKFTQIRLLRHAAQLSIFAVTTFSRKLEPSKACWVVT